MKKEIPSQSIIIVAVVIAVLLMLYFSLEKQNDLLAKQNVMLGSTLKLLAQNDQPIATANTITPEPRSRIGFQIGKEEEKS